MEPEVEAHPIQFDDDEIAAEEDVDGGFLLLLGFEDEVLMDDEDNAAQVQIAREQVLILCWQSQGRNKPNGMWLTEGEEERLLSSLWGKFQAIKPSRDLPVKPGTTETACKHSTSP